MPSQKTQTKHNSEPLAPHPVLGHYYSTEKERRKLVDKMFDSSASHYDWVNSVMSLGSGLRYRKQALQRAQLQPGMSILDVGSGTGTVAAIAQKIVGQNGFVVGLDPSAGMLAEAKTRGVSHIIQALGEKIPFADNTFDVITMGYALRHVIDLKILFNEFKRVLKPNGRVLLLEITYPERRFAQVLLKLYLKGFVPKVSRIFRRSPETEKLMCYYWETIEQCVPPATILEAMSSIGLKTPQRQVIMSVFSEYSGIKPG